MHNLIASLLLLACVGLSPQGGKDTGPLGTTPATTETTPTGTTPPATATTPPSTATTPPPTGTTPPTTGTTPPTTGTTPPITLAISSVDPPYGTNAGGVQVRISGGPFDSTAQAWFGSAAATVVSTSGAWIDVLTPSVATTGPVDVRVTTSAGSGTLPGGFEYFADASGKGGAVGSIEWYELLGGYWTPGSTDFGFAWLYFTDPASYHYWDLFAPSTDTCASNYTGTSPTLRDLGVSSVTLTEGPHSVVLPWNTGNADYELDLTAADYQQNAVYDLEPVAGGTLPTFEVPGLAETPATFTLTQPGLNGASLPSLTRSQLDFRWSGAWGDRILLLILRYDSTQTVLKEVVTCVAANDGAFDVPTGTWSGWTRNDVLLIAIGNAQETAARIPLDESESRVAGIYWLLGGAVAN